MQCNSIPPLCWSVGRLDRSSICPSIHSSTLSSVCFHSRATRFYIPLCLSVCCSVRWSPIYFFSLFQRFNAVSGYCFCPNAWVVFCITAPAQCPPTRDFGIIWSSSQRLQVHSPQRLFVCLSVSALVKLNITKAFVFRKPRISIWALWGCVR